MLNNKRQNYHHSKLPALGDIVTIPSFGSHLTHASRYQERDRKFIVESFNLCDNAQPYSVGIHLVNIALLADRDVKYTVSGFYCEKFAPSEKRNNCAACTLALIMRDCAGCAFYTPEVVHIARSSDFDR